LKLQEATNKVNIDTNISPGRIPSNQPLPLWRNRDYLLLLSGQTVSSFGTQASQLAFPLLVLILTHSPIQAGIISGLRLVPYIVLGLPVGAWVDRWDRKRLMIGCDIIRALALGSIPFAYSIGQLTIAQLYVTSLIEGSLYVFFNVAETSCLPHVVSKEQMSAALGQDQASDGVANMLGPSLGGVLFSLNQLLPFLADAISYALSVISLLFIRTSFQKERQPSAQHNLSAEVIEGLRWLWHQPLLRFATFRACGITFSYAGTSLLIIALMQQQNASSASIGLILAVGGIGHIAGSFLGPVVQKRFSYGQIIITIGWVYFLFWTLYLFAFTPLLLGVVTVVLYMNRPVQIVANSTCRLMLVPDEMRGRVNSIMQIIAWCALPLGNLITGTLLQLMGPLPTILFFSACFLILAVTSSINPRVRHAPSWAELQRLHDIAHMAHKVHSQARDKNTSETINWVAIDRYLIKLPEQDTVVPEVYAFPSLSCAAEYMSKEKWAGIDRYLLRLPDRHKKIQEVYVLQSVATPPVPFYKEKWTDIDRYQLRLPDRHKKTQEAYVLQSSSKATLLRRFIQANEGCI
jgi:MFS family permease